MRVSFALKQQQKLQKEKIVADKEAVMWYTSFSVPYYGFCHRWKVQLWHCWKSQGNFRRKYRK